jgi:extracellular matrix regulatory protein B
MFLHIGNNVLLRKDEIVGIFSIDSLMKDPKGKKFMNEIRQKKNVKDISEGKWSSIIITDDSVYVSRISSITLLGRSGGDMQELLSAAELKDPHGEEAAAPGLREPEDLDEELSEPEKEEPEN